MSHKHIITATRNNGKSVLAIDPDSLHGYWEMRDGSEGGELQFERQSNGRLELVDFDGAYELPAEWVRILRLLGVFLDEAFDY